jgi:hypothetical protein
VHRGDVMNVKHDEDETCNKECEWGNQDIT